MKCDKSSVKCDISITQCDDKTINCEKKKKLWKIKVPRGGKIGHVSRTQHDTT